MGKLTFRTVLQPRGPVAAVVLSEEQVAEVGQGAKKFVRWLEEAKRPETCAKRLAETLVMLREGRTR